MRYYGWRGTILRVDLTKKEITKEPTPEDLAANFLGGEGFGAKLLYDEAPPGTNPLDPEMIFVVGIGPLSGTKAPACGRVELVSRSALTGIFGDSNAGGFFGPAVHRAGYDSIVLRGRAEKPVYLWINDDEIEIRDASHLWGKDVHESAGIIKKETGDGGVQTLSIGPAGENKVAPACVVTGRDRVAGKGGLGAVLGAKNLKMIAARGTKRIEVAEPDKFEQVIKEIEGKIKSSPLYPIFRECGTLRIVHNGYGTMGWLPVRNLQEGWLPPEDYQKIKFDTLKKHRVRKSGCFRCPLVCSNDFLIKEGPYAGTVKEPVKVEYGSVLSATMMGCLDAAFVIKFEDECNRLGLDVMNTAFLIAWAMELYQRGIITRQEADGLELTWGNQAVVLELLKRMAYRSGFGDILADGHDRAAEKIGRGSARYKVAIKGNCTETDVRYRYGTALAFAVSTRGGDHLKGLPLEESTIGLTPDAERIGREVFGIPSLHPERVEGKENLVMMIERMATLIDSLGLCKFPSRIRAGGYDEENLGRLLTAATGVKYDEKRLGEVVERILLLETAYNAREGLRRKGFKLPERFYKDPFPEGPLKGKVMDERILDTLIDSYFTKHGIDPETGIPTRKSLEKVGLTYVADDLQNRGILAR